MTVWVAATLLAAYVSLLAELTLLRVPSVASSLNVWRATPALVAVYSTRYRALFGLPKPLKALLFGAPLLVVYGVYAYPLMVIGRGRNLLDDYLFAPATVTDFVGVALVLAGRALALAAVLTIRRRNEQSGESFCLHTSGPFRWSRNPGLVGMYLFVSGLWVTAPSAAMLAGIVLYVFYMHFKIRIEEDFLGNKFGQPYADYRLRTGRYLP